MSTETINLVKAIMNSVGEENKSEWREILNFVENWPESQTEVEKIPAAVKNIFSQDGTLSPSEEKISITKKQLLDYFSNQDKTKKAKTNIWDNRFITALTESLSHFADDYTFVFSKQELTVNKNINSQAVSDENAMTMLGKNILKTSNKEDAIQIIKTYVLVMNLLELQPKGEVGQLPNDSYTVIMDWVELINGAQHSVGLYWGVGHEVWNLVAGDLSSARHGGYYFLSRNELGNYNTVQS